MILDKLYDYQTIAVDFACERDGAALFLEQGVGKTYITAGIIERMMCEGFTALLVVPLANIETTWARVLAMIDCQVCRSWENFKALKQNKRPRILLLHYEALRGKLLKKIIKPEWSLVVYDESQRLKARGSKQSRAAGRFKRALHRVILSGTPVEQTPLDLWAQFRFACPQILGTVWADFVACWAYETGFMGHKLKFREEKLPEFLKLIEPHILRVKKEDVLDLPPLTFINAPVQMLGEQARVYRELEKEMYTTVQGHEVFADMAITLLIRLQQVCGGFIRVGDDVSLMLGSAKKRRLRVILGREIKPIVVFCKYKEEVEQCVAASTGYRHAVISGKTRKTRTETILAFQRGEIDVLVCQIRAGGVGIDLYNSCVAVVYSSTFSYIDFDQAIARLHRHGQTRAVKIYLLYAQNTVDDDIRTALLSKQLISERILRKRMKMAKPTKTAAKAAPAKTEAPKKTAAAAEEKAPKEPAAPAFKYGVKDLAEALGIKEASVRVRLRNHEVDKAGKTYGWNTKADLQAVVDSIKTERKSKAADDEETDEEAEDEE